MAPDLTRDEHEQLARIARRSYVDGRTQEQIAREYGLSRAKVQRLLDRARSTGIVTVHIDPPPGLDLDLEAELEREFGLTTVVVSPAVADVQAERRSLGRSAAGLLRHRLSEGMRVAVGHGRDVGTLPAEFAGVPAPHCVFVSAMGGSPSVDTPTNPNEIVSALARATGGRAVCLYAPAYVADREMRDRLRQQEAVAQVLELAAAADLAVVGIGGTDDGCTMVRSGCLSPREIARLRARGAVGDVLGNYVDAEGNPVTAAHSDRLVALGLEELRRIPTVVAVARGPEKPLAILGVLRAGIVDALVVDEACARTVLQLARDGRAPRKSLRAGGQ